MKMSRIAASAFPIVLVMGWVMVFSIQQENKVSSTSALPSRHNDGTTTTTSTTGSGTIATPVSTNTSPTWQMSGTSTASSTVEPTSTDRENNKDFYGSSADIFVNFEEVEGLLKLNETLEFLQTFENSRKRLVINEFMYFCPYTKLCNFSLPVPPYISINKAPCCMPCSCDASCSKYKTCCPDVIPEKEFLAQEIKNSDFVCTRLHLKKTTEHIKSNSAFTPSRCMDSAETELVRKCSELFENYAENLKDIVPVTDKNNITYRNRYCAFCNGIDERNLIYWDASFISPETPEFSSERDLILQVLSTDYANINFEKEGVKLLLCNADAVSTCNVTGLWETYNATKQQACAMYSAPVLHNHIWYQNIHCLLCNGLGLQDTACLAEHMGNPHYFSFSGLLNIADSTSYSKSAPDDICEYGFLYDGYSGRCRQLHCSELMKLQDNKCAPVYEEILNIAYVTYFKIVPFRRSDITVREADQMADNVYQWVTRRIKTQLGSIVGYQTLLCGAQVMYKTNYTNRRSVDLNTASFVSDIAASIIGEAGFLYYEGKFQVYVYGKHDPVGISMFLFELRGTRFPVKVGKTTFEFEIKLGIGGDTNHLFEKMIAAVALPPPPTTTTSTTTTTTSTTTIATSTTTVATSTTATASTVTPSLSTTSTEEQVSVSFEEKVNWAIMDSSNAILIPHLMMNNPLSSCTVKYKLDVIGLRPCRMFNISKREFPWTETLTGIKFLNKAKELDSLEYEKSGDDSILICTDTFHELWQKHHKAIPKTAEMIVSIMCITLSLISLLLTLLAFLMLPQLRTLPGKNNLSLIVSLLLAQSMYLVGSYGSFEENTWSCKVVGLLIHFLWLLVVLWMNICTFHMFKVFLSTEAMSRGPGNRTLLFYHLYALAASSVIVCVNVVVSLVSSGYTHMGYGREACYISSQTMLNYTFGIPVAVVVVSNLGMFVSVVIKIKRTEMVQKNVKNERNDLLIFAKLSTLTGATWIFGFVQMWTGLVVFSYLFIVFNAGQGVFLLLSFVVNRRVLNMFKQQYDIQISKSTASGEISKTGSTKISSGGIKT